MVVEFWWWLGFGFKPKLAWGGMGRCSRAYIGVWEELKFELEIKSDFLLKQNMEIRVCFG
jgi:hypothetical protein